MLLRPTKKKCTKGISSTGILSYRGDLKKNRIYKVEQLILANWRKKKREIRKVCIERHCWTPVFFFFYHGHPNLGQILEELVTLNWAKLFMNLYKIEKFPI